MSDQAAGIGSTDKACVEPSTQLDQATSRLHAEIEEAHYAVNGLESRLDKVLNPDSEPTQTEVGSDAHGRSLHLLGLHNAAEEISRLTRRVRSIERRSEV